MGKPKILRTRYIPFETVDISSDELLFRDEDLLVTKWKAIKPRGDISGGISYAFLNKGYKISRFFDADGRFAYWYCDIIDVIYDREQDTYSLNDLLLDIKVMPDGAVKVLDADELAEAAKNGLVTMEQICCALSCLDLLLKMIYSGNFPPEPCNIEYGETL
jgi:protein associated with RNAse G/E